MNPAGTVKAAGLHIRGILRRPGRGPTLEPLIGVTSAQSGQVTVALPSDQPGNPGPGLADEQSQGWDHR
jgi:hypothetical protein